VVEAWKFRYGSDRWTKYGQGNGPFSKCGYMYLVSLDESRLSGFVDIGIAIGETPGLETFSGCYKVTWNGSGIRNAVFTWIPL
jgi:hypothetical protein